MPSSPGFSIHKDYYAILGVKQNADGTDLKGAFFRLAKELHPDKTNGDPGKAERFKGVREAYEVLTDPELRRQYDRACLFRFFAASSTQGSASRPPPTPRNRQPPRRSPSPIRTRKTTYATPAAESIFSDYYFHDYREKQFLHMFRNVYDDAHRAWKQSDVEAKDARDRMYDFTGAPEPSCYRREWEKKRRACEDLRLKKERAEAVMKQHRERAKFLWKRRKAADAKVKRADAARKRTERQRRDKACGRA